jgi:hypothetical protein
MMSLVQAVYYNLFLIISIYISFISKDIEK